MRFFFRAAAGVAAFMHLLQPATARDHIWIVSSATSLPFTKAVAERVAKAAGATAPVIKRASATVGLASLCAGPGDGYPDAASVARRMRKSELDACRRNGVAEIVEIPVGLDMLVVAQARAGPVKRLTLAQLALGVAGQLPDKQGALVPNPHRKWSEVDQALPDARIEVLVPQRLSDARNALQDLLRRGAQGVPSIAGLSAKPGALPEAVRTMRETPPYVVVHESEEAIARTLPAHPNALGIVSYSILQAHTETLRGIAIDGAEPTPENAYAGRYPGTRTLYLYVRSDQLATVRGLSRLGAEYVSGAALGPDGYLLQLGFLPLDVNDMIRTLTLVNMLPSVRRDMLSE